MFPKISLTKKRIHRQYGRGPLSCGNIHINNYSSAIVYYHRKIMFLLEQSSSLSRRCFLSTTRSSTVVAKNATMMKNNRTISSSQLIIPPISDSTTTKNNPPYNKQELQFGKVFSSHMLQIPYKGSGGGGWQSPEIVPFHDLKISPAASSLHYGKRSDTIYSHRGMKDGIILE